MNERSFLFILVRMSKKCQVVKSKPCFPPSKPTFKRIYDSISLLAYLMAAFLVLGMGFASFTAIIPLFVHHLTNSAVLIGLVPAIHNMGWQLPQLFTAGWLARARTFKPLALWMTINERVPYLGLAVSCLLRSPAFKSDHLKL